MTITEWTQIRADAQLVTTIDEPEEWFGWMSWAQELADHIIRVTDMPVLGTTHDGQITVIQPRDKR